jgi:hypothetical protein
VIEFLPVIEPGLRRGEFLKVLETRIENASNALIATSVAADPTVAQRIG